MPKQRLASERLYRRAFRPTPRDMCLDSCEYYLQAATRLHDHVSYMYQSARVRDDELCLDWLLCLTDLLQYKPELRQWLLPYADKFGVVAAGCQCDAHLPSHPGFHMCDDVLENLEEEAAFVQELAIQAINTTEGECPEVMKAAQGVLSSIQTFIAEQDS